MVQQKHVVTFVRQLRNEGAQGGRTGANDQNSVRDLAVSLVVRLYGRDQAFVNDGNFGRLGSSVQ
ncbi:hypothetical protein D9M71_775490 [compost metagenome]